MNQEQPNSSPDIDILLEKARAEGTKDGSDAEPEVVSVEENRSRQEQIKEGIAELGECMSEIMKVLPSSEELSERYMAQMKAGLLGTEGSIDAGDTAQVMLFRARLFSQQKDFEHRRGMIARDSSFDNLGMVLPARGFATELRTLLDSRHSGRFIGGVKSNLFDEVARLQSIEKSIYEKFDAHK